MLLLNTESFELRYSTNPPPKYSVFSHAQHSGDLCFEDFKYPKLLSCKAGFHRLREACSQSRHRGSYWLWTDAVCIDRSSSASLSEAFNNLSRIYQDCAFSLIYLEDFALRSWTEENVQKQLADCAWMRNVWALPHLVFSKISIFYDRAWNEIGTKASLARHLSSVTSIDQSVFGNAAALHKFSIAKRISWASQLQAARIEDWSFCMLGVLNINMPVIYGEGRKTFLRLQEEILRDTADFSLFAWRPERPQRYRGILAQSPAEFQHFQNGPDGPFRIRGEVHVTAAGIVVRAQFKRKGDDLVLPMEGSDGSIHSLRLSKFGQHFLRPCHFSESLSDDCLFPRRNSTTGLQMQPQLQQQDTYHDVLLRVCVKRDMTTLDCRSISGTQDETRCHGEEEFNPEECGFGSPWESCGRSPATPSPSNDFDSQCPLESEGDPYERSEMELIGGEGQEVYSQCSAMEPQLSSNGQAGSFSISDSDFEKMNEHESGNPVNDGALAASISRPPILDANHPFVEAVPGLINSFVERFHYELSQNSTRRSFRSEGTQGEKKPRLGCCEVGMDIVKTDDSGDFDTVVIRHMDPSTNYLACPFYLRNKRDHEACLTRYELRNIEDIREHLSVVHRRPNFCPICGCTFSRTTDRDTHIRSRTCSTQNIPPSLFDGLTIYHIQELARLAELPLSIENHWYEMWATIFPDTERPVSCHYSTMEELRICALHDFWRRQGEAMVKNYLKTNEPRLNSLSYQSLSLVALYHTVLNGAIDKSLEEA